MSSVGRVRLSGPRPLIQRPIIDADVETVVHAHAGDPVRAHARRRSRVYDYTVHDEARFRADDFDR
jgi:hypothetical protein